MSDKPRLIPLTDPDEIASAERDNLGDIVGWKEKDGNWYGVDWSVQRWRERRQADGASGGET